MPLNIKNVDVERLVGEVTELTGESKTEAIRQALLERRSRLRFRVRDAGRGTRIQRFLQQEVWARVPVDQRGRAPTKEEREAILGYGPGGV